MHHLLVPAQPSVTSLPLKQLRDAITGLYCEVGSIQRPADTWLQSFRSTPGSWRLCVQLLDAPHLQEHECYFAANNIKASCQKHQDVLEPANLRELLTKLALHTQACLHKQQWAAANQLSAAAAALAVRAASLQPSSMMQDLHTLYLAEPAATAAAAAAEATAAAAVVAQSTGNANGAAYGYADQQTDCASAAANAAAACNLSHQTLGLHLQQDPVSVAAVLQLLAALPEAALSKQTSVHPDRRIAVTDSLKQSAWPAPILRVALCSRNTKLVLLACKAIVSWCELGVPPQGMASQGDALDVLAAALLGHDTAGNACEAFAALLIACKESSSGSSTTSGPGAVLLVQLLQQLQGNVLPALAAEHQTMGLAAAGGAAAAAAGTGVDGANQFFADAAAYSAVVRSHLGSDAEAAFCRVLCAAAAALLRPVMQGAVVLQGLLELLLQQLLLNVRSTEDGVAMTAVDFWQDSYLATLQALPQEQQRLVLVQQRGVLEVLTAALVQRTQLSPAAAATCTADARDLPEETRMVRRELASALRDIGELLGLTAMLSFTTQLTATHYQHLCTTHHMANPRCNRNCLPGFASGLGLHGIAAGLAAGSDVYGTTGGPRWGPAAAVADCTTSAAAAAAAGSSSARDTGRPCAVVVAGDWLPLESALYAANVVLGKYRGEAAEQQMQQLVQYAAASISHPGGSLKLSGTALTLLGGLAAWLAVHAESLSAALPAILHALHSPDEKLVRNAATCIQRLTSCDQLAAQLTQQHPDFVQQLLQKHQERGCLTTCTAAAQGDDKPTEELLLLSLCSLAVAHTSNSSDMDSILVQLVGLTAAADELVAVLHGKWPEQRLLQHHHSQPGSGLQVHLPQQQMPHRTVQQRQQQQQQQAEYVFTSTAVCCFKALASLVAGLPTRISKHALGVPSHVQHPRHQQQLHQQQQHHSAAAQSGGVLHHHLATAGAAAAAGHVSSISGGGVDDESMCSASVVSDISSNAMPGPAPVSASAAAAAASPGRLSNCQGKCNHTHCQQQPQQQQAQANAAVQARQYNACFIVSQLLHQASHPVMLALRVAAAAAADEQQAWSAQQLLPSLASFLLAALPPAVYFHRMTLSTNNATDGAAANSTARGAVSSLKPGLLLLQLCQLLEQLPAQLVQQPCCLQLLCSFIAAAAAAVGSESLPAADTQQHQQLLRLLQKLVGQCLAGACTSILVQDGAADPDYTCAALALATVSLQQYPEVLAAANIDSLLAMSLAATKTFHLKQCTAVLEWLQVLVQTTYGQQQQPAGAAAAAAAGGSSSGSTTSPGAAVVAALRQRLDPCGVGPQLVLALMLAAAGSMPPDVVLPVSFCLHCVWLSVGRLFEGWLQAAVLQLAPEGAPWQRQRHAAKVAFMSALTESACLTDTTRFKRILKTFCGGKKKGGRRGQACLKWTHSLRCINGGTCLVNVNVSPC